MPTDEDTTVLPLNQLSKDGQIKAENYPYKENNERINRNIAQLVPTKSDAELANELKEKVAEAYKPFLELLNEYDKYGLNVQAGVGKNAFGKYAIVQLQVLKVY